MTTDDQLHAPHQSPKLPSQQTQNLTSPKEPTKWRNKSLSELPGHLRVPVLRRKDTERTQARLEAGVAGLAELRLLREQQTALVKQTMAVSLRQGKTRPPSRRKEAGCSGEATAQQTTTRWPVDRVLGQQQVDSISSSKQWPSTTSLCSITEEGQSSGHWGSTLSLNQASTLQGRGARAHSQLSRAPYDQKGNIERGPLVACGPDNNAWRFDRSQRNKLHGDRNRHGTSNQPEEAEQAGPSWELQRSPHYRGSEGNLEKCFYDAALTSEVFNDSHRGSRNSLSGTSNSNTSGIEAAGRRGSFNLGDYKMSGTKQIPESSNWHQREATHAVNSRHKRAGFVDGPMSSRLGNHQSYMSWDNLLYLAGLQHWDENEKVNESGAVNDISTPNDPDASSDCARSSIASMAESHASSGNSGIPLARSTRSASFCYGFASSLVANRTDKTNNFDSSEAPASEASFDGQDDVDVKPEKPLNIPENLNDFPENSRNVRSLSDESAFIPLREPDQTSAIIRRGSIQCETVLTGGGAQRRKIFNPLHEVDMVAMRTPGPLHAVTLQYSGIPLNALPKHVDSPGSAVKHVRGRSASITSIDTRKLPTDYNDRDVFEAAEKLKALKSKYSVLPRTTKPLKQNLRPILEDSNCRSLSSADHDELSENQESTGNDISPEVESWSKSSKFSDAHKTKSVNEEENCIQKNSKVENCNITSEKRDSSASCSDNSLGQSNQNLYTAQTSEFAEHSSNSYQVIEKSNSQLLNAAPLISPSPTEVNTTNHTPTSPMTSANVPHNDDATPTPTPRTSHCHATPTPAPRTLHSTAPPLSTPQTPHSLTTNSRFSKTPHTPPHIPSLIPPHTPPHIPSLIPPKTPPHTPPHIPPRSNPGPKTLQSPTTPVTTPSLPQDEIPTSEPHNISACSIIRPTTDTSPATQPDTPRPIPTLPALNVQSKPASSSCPPPDLSAPVPHPTPDVSLMSDDGYSTCDSFSPKSRFSIGTSTSSSSSSDWSSLSSGSVSNVSLNSAFFPAAFTHKRSSMAKSLWFSHPLNSPRTMPDARPRSCGGTKHELRQPSQALPQLPEGSNPHLASLQDQSSTQPYLGDHHHTPLKSDVTVEQVNFPKNTSASKSSSRHSDFDSALFGHEPQSPEFDSVFSDDAANPDSISSNHQDSVENALPQPSLQLPRADQKSQTKAKAKHTLVVNYKPQCQSYSQSKNVAVLEKGAIICLNAENEAFASAQDYREGDLKLKSKTSRRALSSYKVIPNKGMKQTTV